MGYGVAVTKIGNCKLKFDQLHSINELLVKDVFLGQIVRFGP